MRVLIIDDEPNIRHTTGMVLRSLRFTFEEAENGQAACHLIEGGGFDAAILDLRLGKENGLDVLIDLLKLQPSLAVVVFTAHASIETAVEAMRRGAQDYLPKPFTPEELRQVFFRLQKMRRLQGKVAELESQLTEGQPAVESDSTDPVVQRAYAMADKAAATPVTVLILGESGTGKTELARRIHRLSDRRERTFGVVHCPSLSRELLESELFGHVKGAFTGASNDTVGKVAAAEGGTLFLDEIGELPLELQAKLLRLLQDREYERVGDPKVRRANVRVIAATNRPLEQAVKQGLFREDLYYRLNVLTVHMPPLRERPEDLKEIMQSHLQFFARQMKKKIRGFSPEANELIRRYTWPGNIRELRNAIERAVILCGGDVIGADDLPDQLRGGVARPTLEVGSMVSLEELEEMHISLVVRKMDNMEKAADVLGIDPATLYRKRKKFNLEK